MTRRNQLAWVAAACAAMIVAAQASVSTADQKPVAKKTPITTKAPATTKKAPVTTSAAVAKKAPLASKAIAATVPVADVEPSITFTGCLEAHGSKYVLTDLQGSRAPKGRSWKTGFLKKSKKNVELVGASTSVKLRDHVGHQVSVAGVQDDETHMTARSVKRLADSCL